MGHSSPLLNFEYERRALSFQEVDAELVQSRPVVAGISPSGRPYQEFQSSEHVALIVGAREVAGSQELLVNDPYPFPGVENPYVRAGGRIAAPGSYWISVSSFTGSLNWAETFFVRRSGGERPIPAPEDEQQCIDSCGERFFDCQNNGPRECRQRWEVRSDYVACGCPDWRLGELECYAVCDEAYRQSMQCLELALATCSNERRSCEARCQ